MDTSRALPKLTTGGVLAPGFWPRLGCPGICGRWQRPGATRPSPVPWTLPLSAVSGSPSRHILRVSRWHWGRALPSRSNWTQALAGTRPPPPRLPHPRPFGGAPRTGRWLSSPPATPCLLISALPTIALGRGGCRGPWSQQQGWLLICPCDRCPGDGLITPTEGGEGLRAHQQAALSFGVRPVKKPLVSGRDEIRLLLSGFPTSMCFRTYLFQPQRADPGVGWGGPGGAIGGRTRPLGGGHSWPPGVLWGGRGSSGWRELALGEGRPLAPVGP